jgi:3-methyladenine DNA glycosylase AlkC
MSSRFQETLQTLRERRFVSEVERLLALESSLIQQRKEINKQIQIVREKLQATRDLYNRED